MTKKKDALTPTVVPKGNAGQFQPGNQLAKGKGRPKMSEEERARSLTTRTQLTGILNRYLAWDIEIVDLALANKKLPIIDMMILKALKNGFDCGSMVTVDWILDHVMGKQAAKLDINQTTTTKTIDVTKLSKEDLLALKEIAERSKGE